jgi:hypothetical protein
MSIENSFSLKDKISYGVSYFEEKTISLIGQEKYFFMKEKASKGFSYFNEKTILLIDGIVELINFKIVSALILLAVVSFGIADLWAQASPQNIIFMPEQMAYLGKYDTRVQSTFYSFYCIAIFSFFMTAGLFFPTWFRNGNTSQWQISSVIPGWLRPWVGLIFWTAFYIAYKQTGVNMLQTGLKGRDFLLALATAYLMIETIKGRFRTRTIALALLAVILTLYILPLVLPYEVFERRLFSMDMHWSAVLGNGLYTTTLNGWEFEAFSNYGVFLNKFIAYSRLIPLFETLGGTVIFLKLVNLVFSGLVIVIIFQRLGLENKRMVWATALLILIVYSARISGVAETFDAPNQLPVRILIVPIIVILAYFLAGRRGFIGPVIFGLSAPVLFFYNFETSIYCILAMGLAIFIENARKGALSVLWSGAIFTLGFLLSGVVLMLILFDGSIGTNLAKLAQIVALKVQSGTSGFAGLPVYFFLPFLWVMLHTFVLFSRYLLSIKDRSQLSPIEFQNIVMIGMIIAIGPYVMNRFSLQNMLVPFLLYTLLVLPKLTAGPKADRILWSFILIVLVIPFIFGNPVKRIWSKDFVATVSGKFQGQLAPCLDGITATDNLCNYALEKADELKQLVSENPDLEWISGVSLNMTRLTGTQPALSQKVPFFFAHSKDNRDILVRALQQLQTPVLAFDYNPRPPGNVGVHAANFAGIHSVAENFQRNLVRSAGYQIIGKTKYWVIARKRYR